MKNLIRRMDSRAVRLAASAVAVAAVIAGAAGIVAGEGNAALRSHADSPSNNNGPERAKLNHGLLKVKGTRASDAIALRLEAGDPATLQVDFGDDDSADFSFARNEIANIAVDAQAGDDLVRIDDSNGAFTDTISSTIDGGDGNDTIAGGKGIETLFGGDGDDTIDGNAGNDAASMGSGDDTFVWDPGDGSDTVEGQDGTDTEVFNGAGLAERFALLADGNRVQLRRNLGNITMDNDGVEAFDVNALGGIDVVSVNDLTGTDAHDVNVNLASTLGGATGDAAFDEVSVIGTSGADSINVNGSSSGITVSGLQPAVTIQHQELTDELDVHSVDGNDSISAAQLAAQSMALTLVGGTGNDTLIGGQGIDTLIGDDGNDTMDGNGGADTGQMDAGDDTFVWDPGDGSDVVEGGDGADAMVFNGAGNGQTIDLSANGPRLKLFRNLGNITMDTDGVERIDVNPLGGADLVTVNDLSATDVTAVNVDLALSLGSDFGDGAADSLTVNATDNPDDIHVTENEGGVLVSGTRPTIQIDHSEAANDTLHLNTLAADDNVDIEPAVADLIQTIVDLGDDE